MNKQIKRIILALINPIRDLVKSAFSTSYERMVAQWKKDQGDKTLRLDYDLDEKAVVFDLGGYEGQWASDIFSRYCCSIHIFEPVEKFADQIERRFAKNNKIMVHRLGLANVTILTDISLERDGSSIYKHGENTQKIQLVKAADFIRDNNIHRIDLMKINIEGGEYDLLQHLIDTDIVSNIINLQIQFHDFVPDADERMRQIQRELIKTHEVTYQYPFVWENWRRR